LLLVAGYPLLGAALWLRSWRLAVLSAGLVAAHLLLVVPSLTPAALPDGAASAPRLRVVASNLYVGNPTPEQAAAALRELDPDVLVVAELDAAGLAGLRAAGVTDDLPHAVVDLSTRDETVGLFSRLPLREVSTRLIGSRALPRATVEVGGTAIRLLPAHPLPPLPGLEQLWRASLADLAGEARAQQGPAVVAGDLNGDRDHAAFRRLVAAGLRDAHDLRGRGLARTWPAWLPVLHLDHVLVSDDLAVLDVREVEIPGSDHLAVVADLAVLD
jgi:endonuclease/exonuclease/phosphatase (EEP) superfamily protein YafD